ncbi:MAG: hypothetical protein QM530_00640 [Phycisphaerales bacterium]|nr:hypothetical protein [Phycisphaerales bacterium]
MKIILTVIVFFFFLSCIKDYKSNTRSYLKNESKHSIRIYPYTMGSVDSFGIFLIKPLGNLQVFESNVHGKTLSPDYGTLLKPYDSIVILFDDSIKVIHLKFNSTITCDECIKFENNRNISNSENYVKTIVEENKKFLKGYFTYTFTEQDYLNAKK